MVPSTYFSVQQVLLLLRQLPAFAGCAYIRVQVLPPSLGAKSPSFPLTLPLGRRCCRAVWAPSSTWRTSILLSMGFSLPTRGTKVAHPPLPEPTNPNPNPISKPSLT